jgi:K+-transporting ATPase ATPase C chain
MIKLTIQSILQTLVWTILLGVVYPLVMTLIAQLAFPYQANGSLIKDAKGNVIGSELIAQQFTGTKYFWPRPSAAANAPQISAYGTLPAMGSNLGPTSATLQANVQANAKALRDAHKLPADAPVPSDLVFTSASGVDPDITPEAARFQIGRVADARGLKKEDVSALVEQSIIGPQLGFLGESRVNVLKLNLALDAKWPDTKPAITPPPASLSAPAPAAASGTSAAPAASTSTSPVSVPAAASASASVT